jgi:hypothetical protein
MIISPPFLPPIGSSASEHAWLDAAMPEVPGQGRFPLSLALQWHNGLHLKAPQDASGAGPLPVRAIADGVVLFVSKPEPVTNNPKDPQNYNPDSKNETEADNLWTDNGMVIVQHTTDIGEGPKRAAPVCCEPAKAAAGGHGARATQAGDLQVSWGVGQDHRVHALWVAQAGGALQDRREQLAALRRALERDLLRRLAAGLQGCRLAHQPEGVHRADEEVPMAQ